MRRLTAIVVLLVMAAFTVASMAEAPEQGVTLNVSVEEQQLFPGETAVFTIEAFNESGAQLEKLHLTELSIGGGTWTDLPSFLPTGGAVRATYAVRIPDAVHDTVVFRLQWEDGEMVAQHQLTIVQPAALKVTAETGDWPWKSGKEHLVDFTVTNEGDTALENVTLTLPGAFVGNERAGDVIFLRKDRRKLKSAQQTDTFLLESLDPGQSAALTAVWTPETLPDGEVRISMQAAVEANGRRQTRNATIAAKQEISSPSMWTATLSGGLTMGHALCTLGALTALFALWAICRARRLR